MNNNNDVDIPEDIIEQALLHWVKLAGQANEQQQALTQQWRRQSNLHELAWLRIQSLDPTLGAMYEIGCKWESNAGGLLFSSSIFDIERSNVPFETIDNRIEQRGVQRHKAAEIALTGLIGNVSLTGSMTYLDAEFIEDDNPNLIGNTPVSVPDFSAS
jgi:outer membrane receptor for monomeric catechols